MMSFLTFAEHNYLVKAHRLRVSQAVCGTRTGAGGAKGVCVNLGRWQRRADDAARELRLQSSWCW